MRFNFNLIKYIENNVYEIISQSIGEQIALEMEQRSLNCLINGYIEFLDKKYNKKTQ